MSSPWGNLESKGPSVEEPEGFWAKLPKGVRWGLAPVALVAALGLTLQGGSVDVTPEKFDSATMMTPSQILAEAKAKAPPMPPEEIAARAKAKATGGNAMSPAEASKKGRARRSTTKNPTG